MQKLFQISSQDTSISSYLTALNRAVHISSQDADAASLTHTGAIKYLQSIAGGGDTEKSDFMVMDVLLQDQAMRDMSTALLTSTVWFDVTNGGSFVSHPDDGLVFESVKTLTKVRVALLHCWVL